VTLSAHIEKALPDDLGGAFVLTIPGKAISRLTMSASLLSRESFLKVHLSVYACGLVVNES